MLYTTYISSRYFQGLKPLNSSLIHFQIFNMDEIDLGLTRRHGVTFYSLCFDKYISVRYKLKQPEEKWSQLIPKIEETFFWLVKEHQKHLDIDKVNRFIEAPDLNGGTCFNSASQCSLKISKYILSQDIRINSITTAMLTPSFRFSELAEDMMNKNLNPRIISYSGYSQFEGWPISFAKPKLKKQAQKFSTSVHFVVDETKCKENCGEHCKSKMEPNFLKSGPLVDMIDSNKIGRGGFGSVYSGKWHGEDVAMKCILVTELLKPSSVAEVFSEFFNNTYEYRVTELEADGSQRIRTPDSGVIIPYAMVRQQNQEFKNGKWVPFNYNIYIYPRYDCNLYELHQNYFHCWNYSILESILTKCLIRK